MPGCGPHITLSSLLNSMPDYPSLVLTESPTPTSTLSQGSIRRRSGAYKSSTLSRQVSTGSQQTTNCRSWNAQDTETDGPNGHAFATTSFSSPNASHFTAIPTRSHRSSLISSHLGPYPRQRECWPTLASTASFTKSTIDHDDSFQLKAHLDSDDDLASPRLPATPVAEVSSAFSQFFMKILLFVKEMPPKAHSGLVSFRRKVLSFPTLRLPTYDPSKSPPPKKGSIPDSEPKLLLTMADKLTEKWPRPRSLRSMPPDIRGGRYSSNGQWGLKRVGGWSQGNMEAALRDSQGLGVDRVGQWTLHKWCLLASVTTVFLLGLTFLVFSILTWFTGKSAITPLTVPTFRRHSLPRGASGPYHRFPSSYFDHIQLFVAVACFARRGDWDTSQLSSDSGGLCASALSFVYLFRLGGLRDIQKGNLLSRCQS